MKRNMDLIRNILLYIEKNHDGNLLIIEDIEGFDNSQMLYHFELLLQANLVIGKTNRCISGDGFIECKGLSWNGQEFLANIRNENVWNNVKKAFSEKSLDFTISLISSLAAEYSKKMLGL